MRNRHDPLTKRLLAWAWAWGDKLEREALPASIPCPLGHEGPGTTVPGHRILMAPYDWLPRDVMDTQRAIDTLNIRQRAVIWAHYVTAHLPLKLRLASLGDIASSVYYQRLDYAHSELRKALSVSHVEKFHKEQMARPA